MNKFDCIIIGGGPAGVGAAKILKDHNINYCVIDKNKFPREKLCGGGLTNKSIRLLKQLDIKIDNLNRKECHEVMLVAKGINTTISLDNPIIMVDRIDFDYNSIKQVTENNLFEQENIISIDNNILITNKDKYEFKYLIFADGLNGYSRKFITKREFGFYVEFDTDKTSDKTIFDFTVIENGYGWIFSKDNHTTIGLGQIHDKKADYIKALNDFANKYNFIIDKTKIRGYHIPVFSENVYNQSVINNQFILVGDAASLTNTVSGEGIYYAMSSGMNAALSIIECLKTNKDLKETYFKKNEYLINNLKKISLASKFLYSKRQSWYIKIALHNVKLLQKIKNIIG